MIGCVIDHPQVGGDGWPGVLYILGQAQMNSANQKSVTMAITHARSSPPSRKAISPFVVKLASNAQMMDAIQRIPDALLFPCIPTFR